VTGYTCGSLVDKTQEGAGPNNDGAFTFMVVQRISGSADMSTEGDSGGPVFVNSSAWGITHGCLTPTEDCQGNNAFHVYTAINYVEDGLDGVVKTAP